MTSSAKDLCNLLIRADFIPLCLLSEKEQQELLEQVIAALNPILTHFSHFITDLSIPRYQGNLEDFLDQAREFCKKFQERLNSEGLVVQNQVILTNYLKRNGISCSQVEKLAQGFTTLIINPRTALYTYFNYQPPLLDGDTVYRHLTDGEREGTGFTSPYPTHITAVGLQNAVETVQERLFLTQLAKSLGCDQIL